MISMVLYLVVLECIGANAHYDGRTTADIYSTLSSIYDLYGSVPRIVRLSVISPSYIISITS
jgi:hypothetical protein